MMNDPFREGLAAGWRHIDASTLGGTQDVEADVVIVGSGAGGGVTAEILANAGLSVVIVEEGPLRTTGDFHLRESEAYPALYQESAARKTADKAINILQGRCVGGSTTVNWTSSFRTPPATLAWWQSAHGLRSLTVEALAPWFQAMEMRLHIATWPLAPNANNGLLATGAAKLGIPTHPIRRNVKRCWDLGYCGMGCPTNAKQSMLVTTIPAALDRGAQLAVQTRAEQLLLKDGRIEALLCQPIALDGSATGTPMRVRAKHYVVAGGAINSPALLLRSQAPDPHSLLGKRTFLHPTVASGAVMAEPVEGWAGAPLSVFSDHFLHQGPVDGPMGYKLEVAPVHPAFAATNLGGFGPALAERVRQFPNTQVMIALLRDGFHAQSIGGQVKLRSDGSPQLDYALNDYLFDGVRRAYVSMAEIQFAAGAKSVRPVHEMAADYQSLAEAKAGIAKLDLKPFITMVGSAHVMGGCTMAADAARGVVRPDGQHWQIANLSVHDGSLFPTSIGANPQLSVYGLANRLTQGLITRLGGKAEALA